MLDGQLGDAKMFLQEILESLIKNYWNFDNPRGDFHFSQEVTSIVILDLQASLGSWQFFCSDQVNFLTFLL